MLLIHCCAILLLLLSLAQTEHIVSEQEKADILNTDDSATAFKKYMKMFGDGLVSTSSKVRKHQKKVFVKNLKKIKSHNKKFGKGKCEFAMTVNLFTGKDHAERQKYLGLKNVSDSSLRNYFVEEDSPDLSSGLSAASSLDWKSKMVPVKQQGSCGSCWAYPTTALIEFAYQKITRSKKALSEQEVLDCTYEGQRDGCQGGWYYEAWSSIIQKNHLASEKDYPYKGRDGRCMYRSYSNGMSGVMKLTGYTKVTKKSEAAFINAANIMPLAVAFHVEDAFFSLGNGVYDGCKSFQRSNHAVTLTGYTSAYYEIKNSWGRNWGNSGYGRFKRRGDICNLLSDAMYIKYQDLGGDGGDNNDDDSNDGEDDSNCGDKDNRCPGWIQYCNMAKYSDYMDANCKGTCGKCGGCTDTDSRCPGWKSYCNSNTYREYMENTCPKTCNKCDEDDGSDDSDGSDEDDGSNDDCKDGKSFCSVIKSYCSDASDGKWVEDNCAKTCGNCGGNNDGCPSGTVKCSDGVCRHEHMCH